MVSNEGYLLLICVSVDFGSHPLILKMNPLPFQENRTWVACWFQCKESERIPFFHLWHGESKNLSTQRGSEDKLGEQNSWCVVGTQCLHTSHPSDLRLQPCSRTLARQGPSVGNGASGVGGLAHSLVQPLSKVNPICSDKGLRATHFSPLFCTQRSELLILRCLPSGSLHVWMHFRFCHC